MAGITITGSPNVAVLDSRIIADLCTGLFYIDASVSVFIGAGASNILGIRVKITNPFGVKIKDYGAGYDIAAPATAVFEQAIPTQGGKYQFGVYIFELQLTDANGSVYLINKSRNICAQPDAQDDCEEAVLLVADCLNGTLTVLVAEPMTYQGKMAESKTASWTITFPSGTLPALTTTVSNFSVQLFEGVYKVAGTLCATYNFGDNVYIKLGYTGTWEKNVKCMLDYSCITPRLTKLHKDSLAACSEAEKTTISSIIFEALFLIKLIELKLSVGKDASEAISQLEELLGCSCTCECSASSPILNNAAATLIQIEGCGVTKTVAGLTHHYQIENYEYLVEVDTAQNYITVSAPSLTDCVKKQQISFSITAAYAAIKNLINNTTEYNYWATVLNNVFNNTDATCLGYTSVQWAALSFYQKMQVIITKACAGGSCTAVINTVSTSAVGSGVQVSWTHTGASGVDVYVDGVFAGRVLSPLVSYLVADGADSVLHNMILIPFCSNGTYGVAEVESFMYIACPTITPPVVSANSVNNATCPYDLTSLLGAPPAGITVEWHTANNTSAVSLVSDPTEVISGVYYAFSKDANGCYSTATQVTLICASSTCSAPQNLSVTPITGGYLVQFQSAAFPPPANSYTVERKLSSDPDLSGSYTTLGSPSWNGTTNRWEILDASAVDNTLYTYRAISNCTSSSPYIDYSFGNVNCPALVITPGETSIIYTYLPVGGPSVDKYEIRLYDTTGVTVLQTQTDLPAFGTLEGGTFSGLTAGTTYRLRMRVYTGVIYKECAFYITGTTPIAAQNINWAFSTIEGHTGTLSIDKNGINMVAETDDNSNYFGALGGDIIDLVLTGSGGSTRHMVVYDVTASVTVIDQATMGDDGYQFTTIAGHTYTVTATVETA